MKLIDQIQLLLNVNEKIARDVLNYIEEENDIDFSEATSKQLKNAILDAYSCVIVAA